MVLPISSDLRDRASEGQRSVRDHMAFFGSWLRRPLQIASVAPSGRQLARLITDRIEPDAGLVLELGPGTGAFTAELIAKGVPASSIYAVEMDERLAGLLSDRFPNVHVITADAFRLSRSGLALPTGFAATISGLPILAMSAREQIRVLTGVFQRLEPTGALYQFTYGPKCPFPAETLARLGLRADRIGGVVRNLPPASVYRIARRDTSRPAAANGYNGVVDLPVA